MARMPRLQEESSSQVQFPGPDTELRKGEKMLRQGYTGNPVLKFFHSTQRNIGFSSLTQAPIKTVLQKYLGRGEYPFFQSVPMFESSFVQVTRRGGHVFIHNHSNEAIIGIASTNIKLPLPNLMFVARPVAGSFSSGPPTGEPILTRLLPLKFVRISIHDPEKRLIKIKLINGRTYYLQLHASTEEEETQFDRWLSLVYLLHHPPPCYLRPKPTSCTIIDNLSIELIPSDEEAEDNKAPPVRKEKKKEEQLKDQDKEKEEVAQQKSYGALEEEYTEEQRQRLQAKPTTTLSERDLYLKADSFESYKGSSVKAKKSRKFSSDSYLSDLSYVSSDASRSSDSPREPPVFPVPPKEGNSTLNIVTIFSAVSKTLDGAKTAQNKD